MAAGSILAPDHQNRVCTPRVDESRGRGDHGQPSGSACGHSEGDGGLDPEILGQQISRHEVTQGSCVTGQQPVHLSGFEACVGDRGPSGAALPAEGVESGQATELGARYA